MRASHILVKHQGSRRTASWKDVDGVVIKTRTKAEAINMLMDLRAKISTQEDFAEIAQEHSDCGSARAGGDLGEFGDGQMMQVGG
ncbi:peptidyl-prolyl cis-trans isomerase 1 [Ectocarpus siliculosus]|uniref:Peptidyl-prolyl cis-trans isomerase n=1 Tax=Ectocarpus siliculosus TaxID=2880 RepID=D8LM37_ECTSI|nr:peptidyl-prolyl cis-trans isomerase 1 [Ectocarpus siliculosus]|eukprot:CBN77251.1 peptidyl-prolyl cis-trans isomerase 1 [Ectocarpus siliculosus]